MTLEQLLTALRSAVNSPPGPQGLQRSLGQVAQQASGTRRVQVRLQLTSTGGTLRVTGSPDAQAATVRAARAAAAEQARAIGQEARRRLAP